MRTVKFGSTICLLRKANFLRGFPSGSWLSIGLGLSSVGCFLFPVSCRLVPPVSFTCGIEMQLLIGWGSKQATQT